MKRALVFVAAVIASLAFAGCPDRKEVIEQVGGAPKEQVDMAKTRINAAEDKAAARAAEADAANE